MNPRNLILTCAMAIAALDAAPATAQPVSAAGEADCYLSAQAGDGAPGGWCGTLVLTSLLVGTWLHTASVAPCNTSIPPREIHAMLQYVAGGTLSSYGNAPPATQGPGFGVWQQVARRRFLAHLQYYRFNADGSFDGVQDISKDISFGADNDHATETLDIRVLNADGSLRAHVCGTAQDERIRLLP